MGKKWFKNSAIDDILCASGIECLGPLSWQLVYANVPTLKKAYSRTVQELQNIGLTLHQATELKNTLNNTSAQQRLLKAKDIKVVTIEDNDYPQLLKQINDPPLWLFYKGNLDCLKRHTLTVVGTRKPSVYGTNVVKYLLLDTLIKNVTIVSGLAYGIDKEAHLRAIDNKQPTAAVLAGGLDSIYPTEHTRLSEKIVENGGVLLSEYPPLSRPKAYRFPVRNRIIAGLSGATVVIEAALKSGTMTTAKSALDYNRDLFAVPADITRKNAEGNNFLLEKGAAVVRNTGTLLEYFGLKDVPAENEIDTHLKRILDLLTDEPKTVDQLILSTKHPIEQLLVELTRLELMGLVYQPRFGCYHRKK